MIVRETSYRILLEALLWYAPRQLIPNLPKLNGILFLACLKLGFLGLLAIYLIAIPICVVSSRPFLEDGC